MDIHMFQMGDKKFYYKTLPFHNQPVEGKSYKSGSTKTLKKLKKYNGRKEVQYYSIVNVD